MSDKQPQRYSEREIGAILKRATELQEDRKGTVSSTPEGLTLEEIEQIAHEVGVDADLVYQAATEMNTGALDRRWHLLGGPLHTKHDILVPGSPTDETLDAMVVKIREHMGQKGRFEKLNGTLTWVGEDGRSQDEISILPEGKEIRIQGRQVYINLAMLLFLMPLFFIIVIGGAFLAEEVGMPALLEITMLIGGIMTVFGLGRVGFKFWTKQQREKMEALLQSLGAMLEETPGVEEAAMQATIEMPEAVHQDTPERTPRRSSTR